MGLSAGTECECRKGEDPDKGNLHKDFTEHPKPARTQSAGQPALRQRPKHLLWDSGLRYPPGLKIQGLAPWSELGAFLRHRFTPRPGSQAAGYQGYLPASQLIPAVQVGEAVPPQARIPEQTQW